MTSKETINAMALSLMFPNRFGTLRQLYERVGSATGIVDNAADLSSLVPDLNKRTFSIDLDELKQNIDRAHKEADYAAQHKIECISADMAAYPRRLAEVCPDAPPVLYFRGNADLNNAHILSIVGTRNSTVYGLDLVEEICEDLARRFPKMLIVSGLAYGTDINAHRAALSAHLPTVGVLAHGLDRIYPNLHRNTAEKMCEAGGLLTEFPIGTKIEAYNFLRRNRIVAGMAEGTLVVESKSHGGALATARMANEYSLAVMACPGRVGDATSEGCNNLIRTNSASLVTSADDIIETLGWQAGSEPRVILPTLFDDDMTAEEKYIYQYVVKEAKHINTIIAESGRAVSDVLSILSELEFRGYVRQLPGSRWYRVK